MERNTDNLCMGCMEPRVTAGVCPYCGFDDSLGYDTNYIPPGTALDSRYIIGNLISSNGESGVYLGYDKKRGEKVKIKEYFPSSLASRNRQTMEVTPNPGYGAQYKALMDDFVELSNELRRVSFKEPVVPVENMIGDNNTIYVVCKYIEALTLEEYLVAAGGSIGAQEATSLLIPVLNCIDNLHLIGLIHRGLSPYTLLVDETGRVFIDGLSLSATRTGGSELKAELYSGYSAPEQYVSTGWQGTWTDVYALATILYRAISGIVPPKSTRINSGRALTPLSRIVPEVSANISAAIEQAMQTSAQSRTQTVAALLSDLLAEDGVPRTEIFDIGRIPLTLAGDDSFAPPARPETVNIDLTPRDLGTATKSRGLASEFNPSRLGGDRDYRDDYEETPPQRQEKSRTWVVVLVVIGIAVLVGIILAVVVSTKMDLGANRPKHEITSTPESDSGQVNPTTEDPVVPTTTDTEFTEEVPDFVGKDISTVKFNQDVTSKFHVTVVYQQSDTVKKDMIISQIPAKGEMLPKMGTIVITVSTGSNKAVMPDLVGMEREQAEQRLMQIAKEQGIDYVSMNVQVFERIDSTVSDGHVINTSPLPGEEFDAKNARIEIFVAMAQTSKESTSSPGSDGTPSSSPGSSSSGGASSRPDTSVSSGGGDDQRDRGTVIPSSGD